MSGDFKTSQTMRNKSFDPQMIPSNFSTNLGNKTVKHDSENKSMQVDQDYNENEKSVSELHTESNLTNIVRTDDEASEGGNGSLKSVEMTTEVSLTKNGGGRKEALGEYLYLQTFLLASCKAFCDVVLLQAPVSESDLFFAISTGQKWLKG